MKSEYHVRGYDRYGNHPKEPLKLAAASPGQALRLALSTPGQERYVKFGLIGADGNCHMFLKRDGSTDAGNGVMADAFAHAKKPPPAAPIPIPSAKSPAAAAAKELADVILRSVLPRLSPLESFTVRRIGELLPETYRARWMPGIWPPVMTRLRASGAISKRGHFLYGRAAELPPPPEPETKELPPPPTQEPSANGANGHSANGHTQQPEPAAVAHAVPAPIARVDLSPDDRIDSVLLLIKTLVSDDRAKKEQLNAIADRLVDTAAQLDAIRSDLAAIVQGEEKFPQRMAEMLRTMRGGEPRSLAS